jgi:serine/threonine-protein kinase
MGEVYEAVDHRLDRTVAVKVLRADLAEDRRFVARFHREARTAARLAHPAIVAVHDFGRDGDRMFLVLEHVPGRTLTELLRQDGRPSPAQVARIGAAVADGLAHAHARGVVHRDMAPGNVMVRDDGDVKILDFGIARAAISSGHGGSVTAHGTVAYAAPEVLTGGSGDQRVDIYGLGAVLYELLAGRPPFSGTDIEQRLRAGEPDPLRSVDASVPAGLEETVLRCLRRAPDGRDRDAGALAAELRRLAAYLPTERPERSPADTATGPIVTPTATARLEEPDVTLSLPARPVVPARRVRGRRRAARAIAVLVSLVVLGAAGLVGVPVLFALDDPIHPRAIPPEALPAPTGLVATSSCDGFLSTGVDLSWSSVSGADGYEVQRRGGTGTAWDLVTTATRGTLAVRDPDLGVDTIYTYRVRALDGPIGGAWSRRVRTSTPLFCFS